MGSPRWLTNSKYSNIVHAKSLTLTGHGLALRVLLPSLQRALEAKRQNIILKFRINCAIVEIQQSQSYHKWLESRLKLLEKVKKRYCGIRKRLTKVIIFYHATCIYSSRLSLQGVDRICHKSSVVYLTSRLTRGGYLLVNYQKSIFYVATLNNVFRHTLEIEIYLSLVYRVNTWFPLHKSSENTMFLVSDACDDEFTDL